MSHRRDAESGEDSRLIRLLLRLLGQRPAELRPFVEDRVASYKYRRRIVRLGTLPTRPSAEILKREIALAH
ncbi:hypothetical protein [Streptomyces sp. NPDC001315]|uniref:hypothetical protein n=1 Tax=Streptomyces sp. NPDC001315 TaxID=3364562 RepID=UPI00368FDDA5